MRRNYEKPEWKIVSLEASDVIAASETTDPGEAGADGAQFDIVGDFYDWFVDKTN